MEEVDTTQETSTQTVDDMVNSEASWNYSDGVAGQGDAPEWFKSDKYKTVADQAKAYPDLESKLGSFTGSPGKFEVNLSEELKEKGIDFDADDPIMEEAFKFAKDSNMSQEGFDKMTELYAMTRLAESQVVQEQKEQELKSLGEKAESRLNNLNAWANKNLPPDMVDVFQEMATSAKAVEAMESIISMTRAAPLSPNNPTDITPTSHEEVRKMQFEKDEYGNRRIATDKEFRQRYEKLRDEAFGTEPNRNIIGGAA